MVPEDGVSYPKPQHSPFTTPDITTAYLRLLSGCGSSKPSLLDLAEVLKTTPPELSSRLNEEELETAAIREASELWRAVMLSNGGEKEFDTYLPLWFSWSNRAGLGLHCPITKLLFDPSPKYKGTRTALRKIRSDWRRVLHRLIRQRVPSADVLTSDRISSEVIGIYFARQLAMQADEVGAYPLEPWIEQAERSLARW